MDGYTSIHMLAVERRDVTIAILARFVLGSVRDLSATPEPAPSATQASSFAGVLLATGSVVIPAGNGSGSLSSINLGVAVGEA